MVRAPGKPQGIPRWSGGGGVVRAGAGGNEGFSCPGKLSCCTSSEEQDVATTFGMPSVRAKSAGGVREEETDWFDKGMGMHAAREGT